MFLFKDTRLTTLGLALFAFATLGFILIRQDEANSSVAAEETTSTSYAEAEVTTVANIVGLRQEAFPNEVHLELVTVISAEWIGGRLQVTFSNGLTAVVGDQVPNPEGLKAGYNVRLTYTETDGLPEIVGLAGAIAPPEFDGSLCAEKRKEAISNMGSCGSQNLP